MPETAASCLLFVRICQLKIIGNNVTDLIERMQTLSLEYKEASGRAIDDDALKAILINQAFPISEYHLLIKEMTEMGQLTDYYSLASALQARQKQTAHVVAATQSGLPTDY